MRRLIEGLRGDFLSTAVASFAVLLAATMVTRTSLGDELDTYVTASILLLVTVMLWLNRQQQRSITFHLEALEKDSLRRAEHDRSPSSREHVRSFATFAAAGKQVTSLLDSARYELFMVAPPGSIGALLFVPDIEARFLDLRMRGVKIRVLLGSSSTDQRQREYDQAARFFAEIGFSLQSRPSIEMRFAKHPLIGVILLTEGAAVFSPLLGMQRVPENPAFEIRAAQEGAFPSLRRYCERSWSDATDTQ